MFFWAFLALLLSLTLSCSLPTYSPAPGRPLDLVGMASGYQDSRTRWSGEIGAGIEKRASSEPCGGYDEGDDIPKGRGPGMGVLVVTSQMAYKQMSTQHTLKGVA